MPQLSFSLKQLADMQVDELSRSVGQRLANLISIVLTLNSAEAFYLTKLKELSRTYFTYEENKATIDILKNLDKYTENIHKFEEDYVKTLNPLQTKEDVKKIYDADFSYNVEQLFFILDALTGVQFDGYEILENKAKSLVAFYDQDDYEAFKKWRDRRKIVKEHLKRFDLKTPTFKNMYGWNAQVVYQVNEIGWRKFNSISECSKLTGLSKAKLKKAIDTNTEYQGSKWYSEFEFKKLNL